MRFQKKNISQAKNTASNRRGQSGQIVIEYVLLLIVVVALATTITRLMIGRSDNPDDQGLIIKGWSTLVQQIAVDPTDEPR